MVGSWWPRTKRKIWGLVASDKSKLDHYCSAAFLGGLWKTMKSRNSLGRHGEGRSDQKRKNMDSLGVANGMADWLGGWKHQKIRHKAPEQKACWWLYESQRKVLIFMSYGKCPLKALKEVCLTLFPTTQEMTGRLTTASFCYQPPQCLTNRAMNGGAMVKGGRLYTGPTAWAPPYEGDLITAIPDAGLSSLPMYTLCQHHCPRVYRLAHEEYQLWPQNELQ